MKEMLFREQRIFPSKHQEMGWLLAVTEVKRRNEEGKKTHPKNIEVTLLCKFLKKYI